jgi:hypothetical protein
MIEVRVESEFGSYRQKRNHGFPVHSDYFCIDSYKDVPEDEHWEKCPCCGLKPKVWLFDNGRSTACGCWKDRYDHFSIRSESIMSVHIRCNGSLAEYSADQLRLNWNEYCATMISSCNHSDLRSLGRW